MENPGQNTMSSEMINELYQQENVGKDKFEKKIESIRKEMEGLMPTAEERLQAVIFNDEKAKREHKERIANNAKKQDELRKRVEDYKDWSEEARIKDLDYGLNNNRIYPSKKLQNQVIESHLHLCEIYAAIFYKEYRGKVEYNDLYQTAALGLINAAKYYIPQENSRFASYASKCIENMIKKVYAKRIKPKPLSYEEILIKSDMLLTYLRILKPHRFRKPKTVREMLELAELKSGYDAVKVTRKINRSLELSGYQKYSINVRKARKNARRGLTLTLMTNLYNDISKQTKLSQMITPEERNIISLELSHMNFGETGKAYATLELFVKNYINRLVNLMIYNKVFKELINNYEFITDEKIIKKANEYINDINKKYKDIQNERKTKHIAMVDNCGIIVYDDCNLEYAYRSAFEEIIDFDYYDEEVAIKYYKKKLGKVSNENDYSITAEMYYNDKLNDYFNEAKESIIKYVKQDSIFKKYDELDSKDKEYREKLEAIVIELEFTPLVETTEKSLIDVFEPDVEKYINQAIETDNLEEKSKLVKEVLTRFKVLKNNLVKYDDVLRKKYINTHMHIAKEQADRNVEYTRKRKDLIDKNHELYMIGLLGKLRIRKFDENTLDEIRSFNQLNRKLEVYIDEDLDKKEYEPRQTLEEEYEGKTFINDYHKCLNELSPTEQYVLSHWLDEEFKRSYSSAEIAKSLNIESTEVVDIKNKAFQKIRKNPIMKKYKDNFID